MIWTTRPRSEGPAALHFWSEGQGPALVLIHGVGLRAEAWGAMMPLLSPHFTVYAVDMPGHGASPLRGAATLPDYTDRFADFIRGLDGPVAVAGHSMGAMIALAMTHAHPDAVQSVGALNAVFERTPEATQAVRARAAALKNHGLSDPTLTLQRWFGASPTGPRQDAAAACRDWLNSADPEGYAQAYTVFAHHDGPSRPALAQMQTPALFLTGSDDPNSTPAMAQAMAKLAPFGRTHITQGAAHMAPMTHPQDIANALITHARKAKT